ncbi:histidinol-phosphatase [Emydomyces testavorans]|uniref:Histidinol-phosphatase n=1 Tax=Emydomyces testavorans TaxID=2070801 RepID=A0AAF0DIF1_9EURO|nr:histidinol-phosphatase [Emydomyces testavorans]
MPFSHHSHSGQFCPGHAKDSLEEVIQTAIEKGMQVFCLSEHMPRHNEDLYPEEIGTNTLDSMLENEAAYFKEAIGLREKYQSQINIPIGFESDWIRPSSLDLIKGSLDEYPCDFFIGSVHHVHTIPIDYDKDFYSRARQLSGGTDEKLFEDYFDDQYKLLMELKPPVIGHFDLIRLMSDNSDASFQQWPQVWEKILRNLDFIAGYGGLLELNSASLRKGMSEPYPKAEICKEFLVRSGRFCLSDDSHGVHQVALNYSRVRDFLGDAGISTVHYLKYEPDSPTSVLDDRFPTMRVHSVSLEDLKKEPFWELIA